MSEKGVFRHEKEEKVLCYHGPLVYEAKIQDRVAREGPDSSKIKLYLVHYQGWNTHWDEWVPESRVLKHNDENIQLQKDRIKEFQRAHKRKKQDISAAPGSSAAGGAAKKRKAGDDDSAMMANDIKEQLRLPQSMKLKLIEDWERITREKKLVPVPRTPSIATLLDHFVQAKAKRTSHERLYGEVSDGMKTFFNQAIGTVLLYKYERKQFREIRESNRNTPYVELYGAEHLLRLFVKLPELLAHCKMQHEHLTVLLSKLLEARPPRPPRTARTARTARPACPPCPPTGERAQSLSPLPPTWQLLKFMQANKAQYFAEEYTTATDEYLQWWSSE